MKAKKILVIGVLNLLVLGLLLGLVDRKMKKKRFGERFRPNSFIMCDSIRFDASVEDVYAFYIHHYDEIYHQTAKKHHECHLLHADSLGLGVEILCREGETDEMVYHRYIIQEIIPNKRIYKSSEPSTICTKTTNGIKETSCNAYVYVDFKEIAKNESQVAFTSAIQMPNYFYTVIGKILGGKKAKTEWENHLAEELTGFRNQYYNYSNPVEITQK